MNERIKQLARQAGLEWKTQQPHYTNTDNPIDFPESANRDLEKFAELIVKETMQVVANNFPQNTYLDVADAVIEHFKE
jgi:hypothetical protein